MLAGHLNDDADHRILQHLNLVTVNPRFGVDASDIASLREGGQEPWLYNMPAARLAAGFYLWRSGAAGLLQWHGRMPTADAFDPTDGREGDAQFLWPTPEIAGPSDLDAELLDLVEAEEDLRWLAWLDSAARSGSQAAADLLRTLRAEVPSAWIATERLSSTAAMRWRSNIVELARELIR